MTLSFVLDLDSLKVTQHADYVV